MVDRTPSNAITFRPSPSGAGRRVEAVQFVAERRERVFNFFSDAFQLETLTPTWLHFSVLTPRPIQVDSGTLIDYRLRLHGVPIRWQSRIEAWDPPHRFVDVQTRGPYRRWRHEHLFEETPGGTICRDVVDYAVPGGWIIDRLVVRRDIARIFKYRQHVLQQHFATQRNDICPRPREAVET
jgi:ligand-binding SRPBCC domain-containing protein